MHVSKLNQIIIAIATLLHYKSAMNYIIYNVF